MKDIHSAVYIYIDVYVPVVNGLCDWTMMMLMIVLMVTHMLMVMHHGCCSLIGWFDSHSQYSWESFQHIAFLSNHDVMLFSLFVVCVYPYSMGIAFFARNSWQAETATVSSSGAEKETHTHTNTVPLNSSKVFFFGNFTHLYFKVLGCHPFCQVATTKSVSQCYVDLATTKGGGPRQLLG